MIQDQLMMTNQTHKNAVDWGGILGGALGAGGSYLSSSNDKKAAEAAAAAQIREAEAAIEIAKINAQIEKDKAAAASGKTTGLSTGAIIGIAFGGVAVLGIIGFLIFKK